MRSGMLKPLNVLQYVLALLTGEAFSSKVAVGGGLLEYRVLQLQVLDDTAGP